MRSEPTRWPRRRRQRFWADAVSEALSRGIVGEWAHRIRRSTLPHLHLWEGIAHDFYGSPLRAGLALGPRLLKRWVTNTAGQGNALIVGLLKSCLDAGVIVRDEQRSNWRWMRPVASPASCALGRWEDRQSERLRGGSRYRRFRWDADMQARHFSRRGGPDR